MNKANQIQQRISVVAPIRSRAHLAYESTFLTWIRTSIGKMDLDIVVFKVSLFIRKFRFLLQKDTVFPQSGYFAIFGILLVGMVCSFFFPVN